jgi:hypothetical protein
MNQGAKVTWLRILCLASSHRPGGRCIAGVTESGEWIRPISDTGDGELTEPEIGAWPEVLEWWNVPTLARAPEPWQPENWLVADKRWKLRGDFEGDARAALRPLLHEDGELFGDYSNFVWERECERDPRTGSLCLVQPAEATWHVEWRSRHRRFRLEFQVADGSYSLPLTDPAFDPAARELEIGEYSHDDLWGFEIEDMFLTLSLGGPFHGRCYKLVAAVIKLPPG